MIKPERMSRIAIVGPRKKLDLTIQSLYELNLFHVVDFVNEDAEVKIGNPLPRASELSQRLLRLRSIMRMLHLEEAVPKNPIPVDEIEATTDQAIISLETDLNEKTQARQNIMSHIRELTSQIDNLELFAELGLPLESYFDSKAVTNFTGTVSSSVKEKIDALGIPSEVIEKKRTDGIAIVAFCRTRDSEKIRGIISQANFQEWSPSLKTGTPSELIKKNDAEIALQKENLEKTDEAISKLKDKFTDIILASEEHYSIETQKAETPLRVATTRNSFVIDGWVPKSSYDAVKNVIAEKIGDGVTVEDLSMPKETEEEQAPVKLKNRRIVKPFELFTELMSTPQYSEFDPTLFVFIVFPLFFGLMIGDTGYGACLILAGSIMAFKLGKNSDGWRKLGLIVIAGGIFAFLFGLILFGEAFGLPFHPPAEHPGEASWEFLFNFPMQQPIMEKLFDVKEFLAISIAAAWIHMSFGLILGFFNEIKHEKKHAAMKILWLIILQGVFIQIMFMARWTVVGGFFYSFMCAPTASLMFSFAGMPVSIFAVTLIISGLMGFFVVNGKGGMMEFMEIFSFLGNVISYTRLAAIGVAKGAMALAFNTIVIENFFNGGNVIFIVIGAFLLVLLQILVFALGSLSSGIQALRLNYVEFFLKFFKGGGVSFEPLGYRRKFSVKESEV